MQYEVLKNKILASVKQCTLPFNLGTIDERNNLTFDFSNIQSKKIAASLKLGCYLSDEVKQQINADILEIIHNVVADLHCEITINTEIEPSASTDKKQPIAQVKNIIAVASGKGGVGKSTVAVNLALALKHMGASVGILDGDIYGPSLGLMLGVLENERPEMMSDSSGKQYFVPIKAHALQSMSMAFLVTHDTPMVWRGPMATGALQQMLRQTAWHQLDYLIIDMPPGTGDIQLTLAQTVPVSGSVIVTTPQDLALLDVKRAIEMFKKVHVPILGIVENMAMYQCPHCSEVSHIFGCGGGKKLMDKYDVPLLAELPLSLAFRDVVNANHHNFNVAFDANTMTAIKTMAMKTSARLWCFQQKQLEAPRITVTD